MKAKEMRIYISGKITGLDYQYACDLFQAVEDRLKEKGFMEVINPIKLVPFDEKLTWQDYMSKDIEALLYCDAIYMIDNWKDSRGARIERYIAREMGLKEFDNSNIDKLL